MGVGLYWGSARLHGSTHSIRVGLGGSNVGWVRFVLVGGVRVCHLDKTIKSVTPELFSVDDLFLWRLYSVCLFCQLHSVFYWNIST